jgi:hypothetical protein
MTRHVRTGEYQGTITRMVRGEPREFPRAVTACGADPTGDDLGRTAAVSAIVESEASLQELCPACRAKVERATGAKELLHLHGRMTGAQESYLKRLLIEASGKRYAGDVHLDYRSLRNVSARYASFAIDHLKAAKERGFTVLALV